MYQNRSEGHCCKYTDVHIWSMGLQRVGHNWVTNTYIWLVKISISGVIKTNWNASEAAGAKEGQRWSNSTLQLQIKKAILSQFDTYN